MLNRMPRRMPELATMLADIGNPSPEAVARALGVSTRSVQRWIAKEAAPRPVMVAIFWLTRWGMSSVNAEAVNLAALRSGEANVMRRKVEDLERKLVHLAKIADFSAANSPIVDLPDVAPQTIVQCPRAAPVQPVDLPCRPSMNRSLRRG